MNERQLQLFLRQAFALANRERVVLQQIDPTLRNALSNVRQLVEQLPDPNSILREKVWREMRPQIERELEPYAFAYERALAGQLADLPAETTGEVFETLQAAGVPAAPQTPVFKAPEGLRRLPLADSTQALLNTQVLGARLPELGFKLAAQTYSRIDQRVRTGMFEGLTTPQIAKGLAKDARLSRMDAEAITRTAIQDANRQLKEAIYDANADVLGDLEWEWVAALDSRTCPICAPLDGKRWKQRSKAPRWPVHIRCRCQVVPVDPDDDLRERTGQVVSPEPMTGQGAYKSKIKVKGEKLYRKAVPLAKLNPTYADFLEQANVKTQQMFFGGGNAGSIRAERFRRLIAAGSTPSQALSKLIVGSGFVPVKGISAVAPPPRPRPKPAPRPKPTPKPAPQPAGAPTPIRDLVVDSPQVRMWMREYEGGGGRLLADSMAKLEAVPGEVGVNAGKLRQFVEKHHVVAHLSLRDKLGDYAASYAGSADKLIESQDRAVELLRRVRPGHKLNDAAEKLLGQLRSADDITRENAIKRLIGNLDGCGGYTSEIGNAVNVYLDNKSKPIGPKGLRALFKEAETTIKDAAAVARGEQVPLPHLAVGSVDPGQRWLGTYIHEIGHQVHYRGAASGAYGGAHKAKGGIASVSGYGLTNEYERFAEAFVQYTLNPSGLREHAPGLYSWVEEAIDAALRL